MRRKPRTKEITTAKVGGKNPDKLKKSVIAIIHLTIRAKRRMTDNMRMHALKSSVRKRKKLLVKKRTADWRFTACSLTNNLHENEVSAFSPYL